MRGRAQDWEVRKKAGDAPRDAVMRLHREEFVRVLKYLYFIRKAMGNLWSVWRTDWEQGKMVLGKVTVLIQGRDDSDLTKIVAMEMEQNWLIIDTFIYGFWKVPWSQLFHSKEIKTKLREWNWSRETEEDMTGCVSQIYKGANPKNMQMLWGRGKIWREQGNKSSKQKEKAMRPMREGGEQVPCCPQNKT